MKIGNSRSLVSLATALLALTSLGIGVVMTQASWVAGIGWFAAAVALGLMSIRGWQAELAAPLIDRAEEERTPLLLVSHLADANPLPATFASSPLWRVVGTCTADQFARTARTLGVRNACVVGLEASYERRRTLLGQAAELGISLWAIDGPEDRQAGSPRLRMWRIDDVLIGEPAEAIETSVTELLTGKVVLVTGAGGSIGAELCRQIAIHQPSLLVLFEQSEYALYSIEQLLADQFASLNTVAVTGDVKSVSRVTELMQRYQPSVVFHAAAYKHVPLMENINAWEAVRNNVLGTYVLARAAIDHSVEKFVLVSTDKAVNPTNVMGASKRLAEMVCQALQQTTPLPKFEMVRFGNVLGSAGSVVPRFESQIARGGPVTVTHPDMVRYFMSTSEAAQLVLQAGSMGLGGEIFVMDMGKPVRILDIAQDMIRLSAGNAKSIPIAFSGLRPGEKLFEELLLDGEQTRATPHPRLRVAKSREVPPQWLDGLLDWIGDETGPDEQTLRRDLKKWVPEYAVSFRPQLRAIEGKRHS